MLINKRAQIAETMTWVVATIIILVILAIAVFAAASMGKVNRSVTLKTDDSSILIKKSLQGYLLTKDLKQESVISKLELSGNFDSFSEKLGEEVFKDPYNQFRFSLELNAWNVFKNSYEKIKINKVTKLEVFKYAKTTANI